MLARGRTAAQDLEVCRLPVSRFPYHLVYLLGDEVIHVLAVAHDYRRPGYWKSRGAGRDE